MGVPKEVLICRVICPLADQCPALFRNDKYRPIYMVDRRPADLLVDDWRSRYPGCRATVENLTS